MATEEDDPETKALARRLRIRRVFMVVGPALVIALPFLWYAFKAGQYTVRERERADAEALGEGEVVELDAALDEAEARVNEALRGWEARVNFAALETWRPGGGRCTVGIEPPTHGAGESYVENGSIDGNYFGGWSYRLIEGGSAIAPPAAITSAAAKIDTLRGKIAAGEATRSDLETIERLASGRAWARKAFVLIVVEERRKPHFVPSGGHDSFDPRYLRGRAYAVEIGSQRVRCVGDIEATNSEAIDFSYRSSSPVDDSAKRGAAEATLDRDFEVELRRAIANGLEVAVEM